MAAQGQRDRGIDEIRSGLDIYEVTGAQLARPLFLGLLAEACAKAGRIGEGLNALNVALETVSKTGERFYEAELHRLKGELILQSGDEASTLHVLDLPSSTSRILAAEECFDRAAAIARRQGARALELRAVMSLSRLWRMQEKKAAARPRLEEACQWFSEGLDTPDLQEATALLERMSK